MTPNDIGREGKLSELDLRKGDRFEFIGCRGEGRATSDTHARMDFWQWQWIDEPFNYFSGTYRITYRAPRDPAHIVCSKIDGQTYDLSKNRIVFGELPEDVQAAFKAWKGDVKFFSATGWRDLSTPSWMPYRTYRVVLPPQETTITVTVQTVDGKPVPGTYTDADGNTVTVK